MSILGKTYESLTNWALHGRPAVKALIPLSQNPSGEDVANAITAFDGIAGKGEANKFLTVALATMIGHWEGIIAQAEGEERTAAPASQKLADLQKRGLSRRQQIVLLRRELTRYEHNHPDVPARPTASTISKPAPASPVIAPPPRPPPPAPPKPLNVLEQFERITDPGEKTEFFRAHRALLSGLNRQRLADQEGARNREIRKQAIYRKGN